ncbi:MAG: type II toxin-antitoxin system prevent-host-death family antitoxin [Candidatus Levybacteria bacterium]|nr:type II toxin-antitoxin system prevent-host-death family antitoxin [Candidatus Levybacteria bacterium]
MTQVMKASEARQQWSQLLNKVFRGQTRVVVEKSGIPVAAVISAEDLERFTQLEEQRNRRFKVLDRIGEAFKNIPAKKIDREIVRAISEVRAERRAKIGKRG